MIDKQSDFYSIKIDEFYNKKIKLISNHYTKQKRSGAKHRTGVVRNLIDDKYEEILTS